MKERVLFIHSQDGFPVALTDYFAGQGLEVERVRENDEARQKIARNHYSWVFYNASSAGEADFVRELSLRVRMPGQVFVTGPNEVSVAVKALQCGASHYWVNPVEVTEVIRLFSNGAFSSERSRIGHQREGTLLQIIKEIALTMELEGLVNILMDSVMELAKADGGAILLLDEKSNVLTVRAIRGLSTKERESEYFGLSERRYYEILTSRQPVFLHPVDPPLYASNRAPIEAIIVSPIWWKEEPLGVLALVKFKGGKPFSTDDFELISLLSTEISGAVHNAVTHHRTKELTIKDDLTDAYNRRYFDKYLEDEFSRARRYGSNLSLIFFDVDNLKEVNVQHGHLIGSKTLQEIAHRIILTVRGIDKVVRYGGDEFCVVLPETDTQGAYQVADRIRNTIADRPFLINETIQVNLTGSIGIASFPAHASSKDELILQADRAMFAIKNRTKNAIGVAEAHSG